MIWFWLRVCVFTTFLAVVLNAQAAAGVMAVILTWTGYDWLRPPVGFRELPNFETEAEAVAWWRLRSICGPLYRRVWRWEVEAHSNDESAV